MPTQKDLKRLVRARMKKTGESYMAARTRLLEKRPPARKPAKKPAVKVSSAPPLSPEKMPTRALAEIAGMSDTSVAKKTGRGWKEWVSELDRAGAATLAHGDIARLLKEKFEVPSWWSQMVAVGYERIRGLRTKGQGRDGSFAVTKSKVYAVPLAELWTAFCRCERWLDGAKLRMGKATKHKYMRMRWSDDTPVDVGFFAKGPAKSQVQLQHAKLATREEAERLRAFWTARLAALGATLQD